jgi:hypothetical protein
MKLIFANPRRVAPCKYKNAKSRALPWLDESQFTPSDKKQLIQIMKNYLSGKLTTKKVFAATYKELGDACTVPIEWWDIVDESGQVRYQLWIYMVDSGRIFVAGTSRVVADIVRFELQSSNAELRDELASAYNAIPSKWRNSSLVARGFEFE